jgi:hypothetical protein
MENGSDAGEKADSVRVQVDPGICGFNCSIHAYKGKGKTVRFKIQSDCNQIQILATHLEEIGIKDIFVPLTRSPLFLSAEKSKCHLACPVPSSLVKAAEVALGLALPKDVMITFET